MMKKMAVWLVVGVSVVAAGCTSKVRGEPTAVAAGTSTGPSSAPGSSGSPGPSRPSASPGGDPGDAIAQYRTVDVCSYLRTDALNQLDRNAHAQVTGGDYTSCYLEVSVKDKQNKSVTYQMTTRLMDGSDARSIGTGLSTTLTSSSRSGHTLLSGTSKESGCVRALVLTDGVTLGLTARPYTSGVTAAQACPVADAMLDSAVRVIADGDASKLRLPDHALAAMDLCQELRRAAADFLGGEPTANPALHGCLWTTGRSESVSLSLGSDAWPPTFPPTGAQSKNLSGRPALISVRPSRSGAFSINDVRMGRSAIDSQKYDVLTVIAASSEKPAAVQPKVERFLAAVAGLS